MVFRDSEFVLNSSKDQFLLMYWKYRLKDREKNLVFIGEVNNDEAELWMNANILKEIRRLQKVLDDDWQIKMAGFMTPATIPKGFDWNFPQS